MKQALPARVEASSVEIWFQDETRIGQQGSITRSWFYRGQRPRRVRQQQFLNAYIFGAFCPARDTAVGLISPIANSVAMQVHLDWISVEVRSHAVIIMDKAGWHLSKTLQVPDNITLIFLPAYSPELNSSENVWQILKSRSLANRTFKSVDHIMEAAEKAWNNFVEVKGQVKQTCHRNWACAG